ncbi:hypothetical protein [Streptomyces sp. NBC_01012]|uniref:hypothetical protein n=1 Tax=Streptomyces sp. NBC_01012 TaxID=2903717 RepID=UPI002F9185C6|nr:hypothetical protein OG623_34940 [Streptomyces sp. NBC_01012]
MTGEHEELFPPWGTVTPAFWGTGGRQEECSAKETLAHIPQVLRGRLTEIAATAAGGRLPDAAWMAYRLDTDVTDEYGPEHLNTVHVREVRAHLAYLAGDHATSLGWYLHTARLRATVQGPGHPDTEEATRRVYSLWRTVPDADAPALGAEVLGVVSDIHGPQAAVARRTRQRLQALADAAQKATSIQKRPEALRGIQEQHLIE